jgi:maleylpyruvate isomerase
VLREENLVEDTRTALAEIEAASERVMAAVATLGDGDLRAPSRLSGWSRGHVVAHLARNADSCWNLLEWARTGAEILQYPNDAVRDAGIEANSGRPAAELRAELRIAVDRFALQARTLPEAAWPVTLKTRAGLPVPAWYVVHRRLRELEAHHIDLATGYAHTDWPAWYVRRELVDTLGVLAEEGGLPPVRVRAADVGVDVRLGDGPEISGTGHEILGWLTGRGPGETGWPSPPSWPSPVPGWRHLAA